MHIDLDTRERQIFQKLDTPEKIQDFLDRVPQNFRKEEYYMSPQQMLRENRAHCIEGALFAAAVLYFHGEKPLIMDLRTHAPDLDHVVALFKVNGLWGAISKTNYASMRYRDPIYRTLRELALSYFHEYFLDSTGERTLYSYSRAFDLRKLNKEWITSSEDQFYIAEMLDEIRHFDLYPAKQKKYFRKADKMERLSGKLREW